MPVRLLLTLIIASLTIACGPTQAPLQTADAPDLVILPTDERVHVDSSRRRWPSAFERHTHLDPESFYGYSGHHGINGILAAAGPGIALADMPVGADITRLAATILALHGIAGAALILGAWTFVAMLPVQPDPQGRTR